MEKVLILFAVILCGVNAFTDNTAYSRISNGHEGNIPDFAYSVSIQELAFYTTPSRGHKCGGAMITLKHVLTAASCAYRVVNGAYVQMNASEFRVFAGATLLSADTDPNRNVRHVENIIIHNEYIHHPAYLNDIAIFNLTFPFLNTTVRPIEIPSPTFAPDDFMLCTIASWGAQLFNETATNNLRYTTKYIYNQNLCNTLYNQMIGHLNVFPSMICAASYDILSSGCIGDEGAPLVCTGGFAGIMSRTNECLPSSYPEIYTRVSNYTDWIRENSGTTTFRPELTLFGVLTIIIIKYISKA